tara:strand:+ start:469 stop:747 length:279 start_codon:yes stop_codon:yes gene_type:complete
MMFVFRAAFWIAVVSAFAPAALLGSSAADTDHAMEQATAVTAQVTEFCDQAGPVCEAGSEAGDFLGILADVTSVRVNRWLAERETQVAQTDS